MSQNFGSTLLGKVMPGQRRGVREDGGGGSAPQTLMQGVFSVKLPLVLVLVLVLMGTEANKRGKSHRGDTSLINLAQFVVK
ncbi:hypothetical protein INR49_010068 [Caranx melampygus]|nr:hypothetical protein INR49_010068 [Caranx melampygus]